MRVVLYADDMEPITVLQLSEFEAQCLQKRREVVVPVLLSPRFWIRQMACTEEPVAANPQLVHIWAESFVRKGQHHLFLFTRDETAAMMLRSELLPGQRHGVQELERQAYGRGFLRGLTAILGGQWNFGD